MLIMVYVDYSNKPVSTYEKVINASVNIYIYPHLLLIWRIVQNLPYSMKMLYIIISC